MDYYWYLHGKYSPERIAHLYCTHAIPVPYYFDIFVRINSLKRENPEAYLEYAKQVHLMTKDRSSPLPKEWNEIDGSSPPEWRDFVDPNDDGL